jgi:trigger factor
VGVRVPLYPRRGKKNQPRVQTNIINTAEWERELEISVDAAELAPHFEKAYEQYRKKIEIRGFRRGKAPLEMVKRMYGESIERESLDAVANEIYRKVAEEKRVKVIGEPTLVDIDYKRGELLRFKIRYEVRPEIQLKEYKGLKIEKLIHNVTEREVESEVERLRQINRTTMDVESAVDDEHILTVDLQEVDSAGFPIVGKRNENVHLYLKDESLYPQLKQTLRNAERGKEYLAKVEVTSGKERHETNFLVKVKKVEKVTLPEFNDEFVAKITKGKVTSKEQFRANVKKDLAEFWKQDSERKLQDAIVGEIIRRHDFTVPEGLVKYFLDSFIEELRQRQPSKKLPENFNEEEFRKENRAYAIYQAKWLLLKEKIISTENIAITDGDLEQLAGQESEKMGIEKARLLNYYKASEATNSRLLSEKLMKFLKEHAAIKEKTVEGPKAA